MGLYLANNSVTGRCRASMETPRSPPASRWEFLQDLRASPVQHFVESLKTAYISDKGKSRFEVLRLELTKALERSSPEPGPCTFVAQCIEALVGCTTELSHLVTHSLNELDERFKSTEEDVTSSRKLAAKLFQGAVRGELAIDERVLVRLVSVFGVQRLDAVEVMKSLSGGDEQVEEATQAIEAFILNLVKRRLYSCAVSLLKQFDLRESTSQEFLVTMLNDNVWDLAGEWASHLGGDNCCFLVQKCMDMQKYKIAYRLVQRYGLSAQFPDAYHLYKRSSLRKLADKGLWDVAKRNTGSDRLLQEHLVILALERRQQAMAAVLCEVFELKDFDISTVEVELIEDTVDYIQLNSVVESGTVVWVDDCDGLQRAVDFLCAAQVVGIDCEWKPVSTKGTQPKASILQLATREKVFVLDMLALPENAPEECNKCIGSLFQSEVIKLGYDMHNDLDMLSNSCSQIESFRSCSSLLDLQTFPDKVPGGLSGLTKLTIGSHLDKSVRMSDWNQRPLSREQLHYAALDAAILLPIHEKLCSMHSIMDLGRSYARSWSLRGKENMDDQNR